MRILWIALFAFTLSAAENGASVADTHTSAVAAQGSERALADAIRQHYEAFIDTKPSAQKRALALKTKASIETFQAAYPDSELMPSIIRLLEEVDLYLEP